MKKSSSLKKDMKKHIKEETAHIKRDRKEFNEIVNEDKKMLKKMGKKK